MRVVGLHASKPEKPTKIDEDHKNYFFQFFKKLKLQYNIEIFKELTL
jgi:hypothetical protein